MKSKNKRCAKCGVGYELNHKQKKAIIDAAQAMTVELENEVVDLFKKYLEDNNVDDEIMNELIGLDGGIDSDTPEGLRTQMIDDVLELLEQKIIINWSFKKKG